MSGPPDRVLELLGLQQHRVVAIKDVPLGNGNWLIVTAAGHRFVLRRYHVRATREDLAYEHAVLGHLAAAGWVVPRAASEPVCWQGRWYCLTRYVPGEAVTAEDASQSSRRGRDLARLHLALRGLDERIGQRPGWRPQHTAGDWEESVRGLASVSPRLASWAQAAAAQARDSLAATGADDLPVMVVHGDFAEWNVHYEHGQLAGVIDFGLTHVDTRPYELAIARTHRAPQAAGAYRAELAAGGWPLSELEEAAIAPLYRAFRVAMAAAEMADGRITGSYDLAMIERQLSRTGTTPLLWDSIGETPVSGAGLAGSAGPLEELAVFQGRERDVRRCPEHEPGGFAVGRLIVFPSRLLPDYVDSERGTMGRMQDVTDLSQPVTAYDGCGKCLVGVIRLSRMTDKTSSPQKQVNHILTAAAATGAHIIAWAIDLEVSGATNPLTRPGLGPWLRGESGHYDGIAAYDVVRVGRNVRDVLNTQQLLTDQGRLIVTADHDGIWDFTDPNEENMWLMLAWGGQMELRQIQKRNRHESERARAAGDPKQRPSYGYKFVRLSPTARIDHLAIDEVAAGVIREVARRILADQTGKITCATEAARLNREGVPAPSDRCGKRPARGAHRSGNRGRPVGTSRQAAPQSLHAVIGCGVGWRPDRLCIARRRGGAAFLPGASALPARSTS